MIRTSIAIAVVLAVVFALATSGQGTETITTQQQAEEMLRQMTKQQREMQAKIFEIQTDVSTDLWTIVTDIKTMQDMSDKLGLTPDQKSRLDAIRKDAEAKMSWLREIRAGMRARINEILTPAQQQQFEQSKKPRDSTFQQWDEYIRE